MVQATQHLVEKAVHRHPALSKEGMMERLFSFWFDSFVYNQIWEDPRVDLEALQLREDSRVLTIASGGCNALNYLSARPAEIVALDINRYHIYFTRLKLAALAYLPTYENFYSFFGFGNQQDNVSHYNLYLSSRLDSATRSFWEGETWLRRKVIGPRINYFAKNIYDYAKLGYLLRLLHGLCKVTRKDPARILHATTRAEQEQIFEETLAPFFDNRLVKIIGSQPLVLFSLGIPPRQLEFLQREMRGNIMDLYRERVKRLMCDFPIEDNYFTWQALTRGYDHTSRRALPEYLKPEGYELRKQGVHRIRTEIAHMTQFLQQQPKGAFDRFVLLDSQDWMESQQITALWTEIDRVGKPGTRIIFRSGSSFSPVEEALPTELRRRFVYAREQSEQLLKLDRAAIYGGFHLYTKAT